MYLYIIFLELLKGLLILEQNDWKSIHEEMGNETLHAAICSKFTENPHPKNALCTFVENKVGYFLKLSRVLKLYIWLLRGSGRCLRVTLQTYAPTTSAGVNGRIATALNVQRQGPLSGVKIMISSQYLLV